MHVSSKPSTAWASCEIRKLVGCAWCDGNAGKVSTPPRVSDPIMHHGTCVTHVPWCMMGSLTSGLVWSYWRGKCFWYSRRMHNPKFYVSGKRPMYQANCATVAWPRNLLREWQQDDGLARRTKNGRKNKQTLWLISTWLSFPCVMGCELYSTKKSLFQLMDVNTIVI